VSVLPADSLDARLERRIFSPLAQLRRRCRLYLALEGLVRLGLLVLGASLAQLLLDRWLKLTLDQRGVLSAIIMLVWLWLLYRHLLAPLLRPLSDRALALAVDRAHPPLRDRIATAVQFARGDVGAPEANSPRLVRAVLGEACDAASDVSFLDVLSHRRARRRCLELGGTLLASVILTLAVPDMVGTWFRRNWLLQEIAWPQQTYIRPVGFDETRRRRVPRGDELEIAAVNEGRVPSSVELRWWTDSGREGREPMTLVGSIRWEVALGTLSENVSFRIVGGDERTREHVVVAVDRPRVVSTTTRITPPAYAGLETVVLEQQTVLELLSGSTLQIDAQLNRPVESARFVGSGGVVAACQRLAPDRLRVVWDEPASGSYSFELVDRDGWANLRPVRYTLKVMPDLPPEVQMELPDVGESITPSAELPVAMAFADTYGLGGVELRAQRQDDPPFDVPLDGFEPGLREFAAEASFDVRSMSAAPGDRVRIWATAHDQDPAGPNVGRTEPVGLQVVTATEFLTQLAGRELELRREFERLISAQRGLNDALRRLLPQLPDGEAPAPALSQRLAGLARRQESHARSCLNVGQQFRQILSEMQINKVARAGDERRIGQRIIAPLERLGTDEMPAAAAALGELRRAASRAGAETLPARQAAILREMETVLANMLEWEGYREALALLQEIIAAQANVHEATAKALERQLEDILGLDQPPEPAPNETPGP
jgi:hypothetical protein